MVVKCIKIASSIIGSVTNWNAQNVQGGQMSFSYFCFKNKTTLYEKIL